MTKEELYQKYIVENMLRKDCAAFFNVNESYVKRKIKEFGLVKTLEQKNINISRSTKVNIDKNVLFDLYINKNLTISECAKELNTTFVIIKKRLREFNIKKGKEKFKEVHKTHSNQTLMSSEKRKNTVFAKYGVENVSKLDAVQKKKEKTTIKNYGVSNPFQSSDIKSKIKEVIFKKYGVPYSCMRQECRKYSKNNSVPNKEFAELLDKCEIEYEREYPLSKFSYDFKIKDTFIEINPTIFHNTHFAPVGKPKTEDYHYTKYSVAKEFNYKCIHVFDWDSPSKVINTFFIPKEKIYARKCELRTVNKQEAREFLEKYHLQGYANDKIRLGLYFGAELVEIMTFDKPRYNKNYEYELVRLCSNKNVVGGAEKILNHFIKMYNPKNIISYCDISKFSGKIYDKLGFKLLKRNAPSKHWYNIITGEHVTDNLLRQRGFDQLFKTNFGKGTSNELLMLEIGFLPVYDCGQLTYELKLRSED